MRFSDEGKVVENKMLNAVLEQGNFLAAFTGKGVPSFPQTAKQAGGGRAEIRCWLDLRRYPNTTYSGPHIK